MLHFAWRTTSLRVGGRAARRSCLPGLRRGGGRQAGAAVLSCLVWRCELTAGQVSSASECVRRSHCTARHTTTQNAVVVLSGRLSSHRHTPDTTKQKQSCLCRVWRCVAWRGGVTWTIAWTLDLHSALSQDTLSKALRCNSS